MTDNITPIRPAGPGQIGEGGCPKHGMAGVYGGEFKDGQHRVFCDLCNAEQAAKGAESAELAVLVEIARIASADIDDYVLLLERSGAARRQLKAMLDALAALPASGASQGTGETG